MEKAWCALVPLQLALRSGRGQSSGCRVATTFNLSCRSPSDLWCLLCNTGRVTSQLLDIVGSRIPSHAARWTMSDATSAQWRRRVWVCGRSASAAAVTAWNLCLWLSLALALLLGRVPSPLLVLVPDSGDCVGPREKLWLPPAAGRLLSVSAAGLGWRLRFAQVSAVSRGFAAWDGCVLTLTAPTAPSQTTLPEHEPLKFSPRIVSRLDEEDEEWQQTLRPAAAFHSRSVPHSRESSIEKLQRSESSAASHLPHARSHVPPSRSAIGGVIERVVDPKASSYGHHRQTSIVHGIGIQHSRNGSLASSASSPLSPQMIAAAGASLAADRSEMNAFARFEGDGGMGSRPPTALSGSTVGGPHVPERSSSTAPENRIKLERMQSGSGKTRRDHAHQHSHSSRHHKDEQKTVGEYALHVLFTSFIAQAEEKLNECITVPFDPEPQVEQICGPGVDAAFDQLIVALGHIAKQKPKPLIDSMMLWRKSKSDAANEARNQLQQSRTYPPPGGALQRRNTEPVQPMAVGGGPSETQPGAPTSLAAKQEYVAQAERRSTVSIYILCRVLIEVMTQSTLASITPEMEDKLENIIFGQLKISETDQLLVSPLKLANWNLFAQLLGAMSEINFTSVCDRFIADLDRSLQDLTGKNPTSARELESKMELVLGGMKHLRIKTAPEEAWDQSCEFMASLGKLFSRSHGLKVKSAFCQVLEMLLLPIAAKATNNDLAHPRWNEVLATIGPRLAQMFVKPRHWSYTFPLTATMLCVSSPETFASQWLQLIYPLQPRLKDRYTRPLCLQVISRLLWTYLYRTNDNMTGVNRKLDEVLKSVLPSAKRTFSATDTAVTEPLIQIVRIIGFKHPEYCFRNIIFPLVSAEHFTSNKDLKIDHLDPDKMVIGIRAFLALMSDLEKGDQGRPPFPQVYAPTPSADRIPTSPVLGSPRGVAVTSPVPVPNNERLSKPVLVSSLSDSVRDYYTKFCEILGKITVICDSTFGGQAALDEKFNSPGPKTPITETFNFSRRDDHPNPQDQKQAFYELLHVAVQALPRCLSLDIPFNTLINLLCTGTAHVQSNIAESSAQSLKAIARQSHAQQVTMGFARFIFNFDDRYSTMSDGGMLGPGHIEKTLKLYVELLHIWIDEIRQKARDATSESSEPGTNADKRGIKLDLSGIWAEVDQVEAHGLFFLCSQSRRVRYYAINVLRLITEFDAALRKSSGREKDTARLIDILENDSMQVMSFKDEHLSVAERSRLQRGMQNTNSQGALIELCTSDVSYDTTLWFKIFPNFVRIAFDKCPFTITIGRDLICNRILQMYKAITILSEPTRGLYYGSDPGSARLTGRTPTTQPEVLVEQWKLYLVFACTTLADPGSAQANNGGQNGQHGRKGSKTAADKIVSARTLFKYLNPLLSVTSSSVRDAVVVAMGSINVHIYRTLLEELQGHVSRCNDEARARIHQRTNSSPRRNRKMDLLRTEITHVYKLTSHFLKLPEVYQDDWILGNLVGYAKDLKLFLMDGEVQMDWEFQQLRRHYCGLMEELWEGVNRTKDPSRWITFESRKSSFALMEDWCGFSPNQSQIRQREDSMRQSLIDQQTAGERGTLTAAMEIEKRNLRTAALSAMAALCGGPINVTTDSGTSLQFDIRRMLAWIEAIFNSGSDRMNVIGRRALKNLIVHNQEYPYLLEHCIARCYVTEVPKVLESYFTVVTDVLLEHLDYPCPFWKLLSICLFTLGNDQGEIRSKSAHVLRALEERQPQGRSSKIQDFDISISDKTKAVYKLAQFEISKRLAKQHTDVAFHIFSEFTLFFKDIQPAAQRNVIAVILPWIQCIELKVDPNGGPIAQSYVLLANLLELTIKSSAALHNEVQALWQALATGPHPGNVRLVLDFIMSLCLERREQNFVEYAKQIVVFLASTNSTPGNKVVEFLLVQINPKAMVPNEKRESVPPPPDIGVLPYCADLAEALPVGTKQTGFSLGQLSLILLVDLMVAPVSLVQDNVPVLLQVVTVLWDHYTALVQEQAREMLVHLIHELVISRLDDETPATTKHSIEGLIDAIRRHDRAVVWGYEDSNGKVDDGDSKVPASMEYLTAEVVKTFELTFPGIKDQWGRLSLTWATSCPVRHLACRSFQIFRCILTSLDHYMLGDMLARLSNTIADEDTEIQTFSMEILTTLKTLIAKLEADKLMTFPQLFWTTCACLESINECEFMEAIEMLNEFLDKLDFHSPSVRRLMFDGQPPKWDGPFEGLQPLLYKGLRSSTCLDLTLSTLEKLIPLPSDNLIGDDSRLFFTILANFPRFLHGMDQQPPDPSIHKSAETLLAAANLQGLPMIALVLRNYLAAKFSSETEFVVQMFAALREYYSPAALDFRMVTMLMGFLTNGTGWVKLKTMKILCVVIPEVDMKRPEMAGHGSDLISPLLRLLQTEYCMEALEVLDNIMTMSGSSMDKHHLRMSMTRSTSKAIRKEYERTQSLFGIPEGSGWAIPMPARKTDSTRANIHAAFYMCQSAEGIAAEPTPTPEVEFHADEFPYGYFPASERADTMMSDDVRGEPPMGDLVSKLDSLDDFFDDLSTSPPSDGRSSRTITEFSPDTFESGAQLYDEQILPILHQASNNTSSFQNGFADRPILSRDGPANTMNPGAFNVGPAVNSRPGLHSRSITSPSAPASYHTQIGDFTSDDEFPEDVFSDGDDERPNTGNGESSFLLESMVRPLAQSTRSRMRRMTGGRSSDARFPISPPQSVPKVPSAFLTQQQHQQQGQQPQYQGDMITFAAAVDEAASSQQNCPTRRMGKRFAPRGADGGPSSRKRQKVVHEPPTSEEVNTSRQLRQLLAFSQDVTHARHGLQSFKLFLEASLNPDDSGIDRAAILADYLQASKPREGFGESDDNEHHHAHLPDIMQTWSYASQTNNDNLMSAAPAVLALLLRVLSRSLEMVPYGLGICRTLLHKRQLELISRNLSAEKGKAFIISPTLRLLREAISFDGGAIAKPLFRARAYTLKSLARNMGIVHIGDEPEDDKRPSTRSNAILFFLSALKFLHPEAKKELITQRDVVSALTRDLKQDPRYLVLALLNQLRDCVLLDDKVPREAKGNLLHVSTLVRISALYQVRQDAEDNTSSVADAAHDFLMMACTNPSCGVLRLDSGLYPRDIDPDAVTVPDELAESGLEAVIWVDKYRTEVPVRNFTLSNFLPNLRPWASVQQSELVTAIFAVAPELVAHYFQDNKSFTFEPKLSATWIGYAAFIFKTVTLPIPENFCRGSSFYVFPPPTSVVIDNILPLPLTQKALARCLANKSNMISFFATRILVVATEKLEVAVKMHLETSHANEALWAEASRRLIDEFCQRIPGIKDMINSYRAIPEADVLHREAASRLLRLCYEVLPQVASMANLDVSAFLEAALTRVSGNEFDDPRDFALQLKELENLLAIAWHSAGMRWFSASKTLAMSPFTMLLKVCVDAPTGVALDGIRRTLGFVAAKQELVPAQEGYPGLLALFEALQDMAQSSTGHIAHLWPFLDNSVIRCAKSSFKYYRMTQDLAQAAGQEAINASVSPLAVTILDQLPFALKAGDKSVLDALGKFLPNYLGFLVTVGESKPVLEVLYSKMAELFGSSQGKLAHKKLREGLEFKFNTWPPKGRKSLPKAGDMKPAYGGEKEGEEAVEPGLGEDELQALLEVPDTLKADNSALVRWVARTADELIDEGYAASLIKLLASEHASIRREALVNILKAAAKIRDSEYEEKDQVWLLLSELGETARAANIDHGPLPSTVIAFACHALGVLRDPLSSLYPKVNEFLVRGPTWHLDRIPLVDEILLEEPPVGDSYYAELSWLLGYLIDSLRTSVDLELFHKRRAKGSVLQKVMTLTANPHLRKPLRLQVLRLLYRLTQIEGGSTTLTTRFGVANLLDVDERRLVENKERKDRGAGDVAKLCRALKGRIQRTCNQERVEGWSKGGIKELC
ncbi:cell morphogenesis N-terminal-domain-containing protein [Echria macrotheca]|uniref:Cell morphogenesis N-terminal-domain-containing protein n=1 Tax=Echria macrotheca TaxID=438768 RepID=A0AAJ0FF24_9PEZI|nr:cell morphogenesis N-terminal-domain-containing protein [Echria macrotheca]